MQLVIMGAYPNNNFQFMSADLFQVVLLSDLGEVQFLTLMVTTFVRKYASY